MNPTRTRYPFLVDRESAASDRARLANLGFTTSQIDRLFDLRAIYPIVEFVDSREELMQLTFLKWLHARWVKATQEGKPDV